MNGRSPHGRHAMALPSAIRVKLLPDEAGAISLSPVVVREMPLHELMDAIVAQVGKDSARVRRLLEGGTLVSGASRYRWEGCSPGESELEALLRRYPDPDPGRAFAPELCRLVVLHFAHGGLLELRQDALVKRSWFRRKSFWDVLLELVRFGELRYRDYCYSYQADRYRLTLTPQAAQTLSEARCLLAYSGVVRRLQTSPVVQVDFLVTRPG